MSPFKQGITADAVEYHRAYINFTLIVGRITIETAVFAIGGAAVQ